MRASHVFLLACLVLPHAASLAGFGKPAAKPGGGTKKKAAVSKKKRSYDVKEGKKSFEAQMRSWNALHEHPMELDVVDLYVRTGTGDKYFFVGKAAARKDSCEDAGARSAVVQKRLVLEHSKLLQLQLRTSRELSMWCAPGGTEMKVAQKQIGLRPLDGLQGARDALTLPQCGFLPEQYEKENGEVMEGFYVRLPPDGQPPEGAGNEVKIISPDELEEMQKSGKLATG